MQNETLPKYIGMPILEQKVNEAERMKMAQTMMGQQEQPQSISDALMAKANQFQGAEPVMAAGGGIIAFQAGGLSFSDVMRQATLQEQRDYQRTGVLPARLQKMLTEPPTAPPPPETTYKKPTYKGADINDPRILEAQAGRGPDFPKNDGIRLTPIQAQLPSGKEFVIPAPPAPGIAPSTKPAPVIAAPVQPKPEPKPEPKPQGITSVAEPTLEQEMADYQKAMAAAKGEDTYGKFLEEQAKKNVLTDTDYLLRAAQGFGAAGNILAGKDASKELGALATQRATDVQAQQARAEAAAKRADMDRGERGEAFKTVYGTRAERAKEKRAETRKKEEMKAEQEFKREISKMEIQARVDIADKSPSSQVEYIGKLLDSDDAKKRALGERLLPLIQGMSGANLTLRIQKQAEDNVDKTPRNAALKFTNPEEYRKLVNEEAARLNQIAGVSGTKTAGEVDTNHPLLKGG
jgi:hypothetical protein